MLQGNQPPRPHPALGVHLVSCPCWAGGPYLKYGNSPAKNFPAASPTGGGRDLGKACRGGQKEVSSLATMEQCSVSVTPGKQEEAPGPLRDDPVLSANAHMAEVGGLSPT